MIVGQRIVRQLPRVEISQAELARRVGMSQSAMNNLIAGRSRSSTHLHKIARELGTTPAYLTGETDDPDKDAVPPPPVSRVQHLMMPVALPSEAALADMYEGQLRALGRLKGAELARALAKRLPKALARLQGVELYEQTDDAPADDGDAQLQPTGHREPQRAQRT